MSKAIVVSSPGENYQLSISDVTLPSLKPTDVLVRHKAVGVNHYDIMQAKGMLPMGESAVPGCEAVGIVEEIGSEVDGIEVGSRVAYATSKSGAYAQKAVVDHRLLVDVPASVTDNRAASLLSKGSIAHCLVRRTYFLKPGNFVLVHGAAGGVGHVLTQWAKHLEAHPIGVVSSEEKAEFAKKCGCDHVIVAGKEDVVERVRAITKGDGVRVAYDPVGQVTFDTSVACLAIFGLYASYGQVSGPTPPIDLNVLRPKGNFATSTDLFLYKRNRMELVLTANDIFELVKRKMMKVKINEYPFEEAKRAHEDMLARKTIGCNILTF